jgi:hypothetical protein
MSEVEPITPVVEPVTPVVDPVVPNNWLLSMPEELQNDPSLNTFPDVERLARSYVETKRMVGDRFKLPDENTPADEVQKFYSRLGVPDTPEQYEFTKVDVPTAVVVEPTQLNAFKKVFHDAKLTKSQADKVQSEYLKTIAAQHNQLVQEYTTQMRQQEEVLKGRWGDSFENNKDLAIRTFEKNATPSLKVTVEKEGWGNNPDFIELFYNLGVATGEDKFVTGGPVEAKSLDGEIKQVETELFNLSEGDPRYKELLKKRDELYNKRYPQPE